MKRLQLPKNKFALVGINAGFIAIWFLLLPNIIQKLNFLLITLFAGENLQNVELVSALELILGWSVIILPIALVTKYIWFPQRPKITRSKD